ncbi:hypothetical protein G6F57_019915 [Rhizopus arrhizus]|nr:hypothetical protein G6F57_019915 [Rhizopus arrhizus]
MADSLSDNAALARASQDLYAAVRRDAPLVQCLTNFVSMNFAANVLLAMGASPAMVHATDEAPEFAQIAGAVVINIGTLSAPWLESMLLPADAARQAGIPWVLDPVAHHATAFRRDAVQRLLALRPAIIRGNASEIIAPSNPHGPSPRPTNRSWPLPAKPTTSPTASAPCASRAGPR